MAERGLFAGREAELLGRLAALHGQLVALTQTEQAATAIECAPRGATTPWRPPTPVPKDTPAIFTPPTGRRNSLDTIRRNSDYNPVDHQSSGYTGTPGNSRRGRPAHVPTSLVAEFDPGTQDVTAQEWRFAAACAQTDPEVFFPERNERLIAQAKKICGSCAVKQECADYAIENGETNGVWGGMDQDQLKSESYRRRQPDYQPAVASFPELRLVTVESEPAA